MNIDDLHKFIIVNPNSGCWEWNGKTHQGYGRTSHSNKSMGVHRAVYSLMVGPLLPKYHIHHKCLNKSCCNPDHLEQLTYKEHAELHKILTPTFVAFNSQKTHCPKGHLFTPTNIRTRSRHPTWRECLICEKVRLKTKTRNR